MNSSAKIMKANGIIHIVHGAILALLLLYIMMAFSTLNAVTEIFIMLLVYGGISFLYIYIGYVLSTLQKPNKIKGLLITSLVLACIEVVYSAATSQMAGIFFIIELVMDIVCLCNLDAYRKYSKSHKKKSHR